MTEFENNKIIIKESTNITIVQKQLEIKNRILAQHDIYYELLDLKKINKAIELSINARMHLDPLFNIFEITNHNNDALCIRIYQALLKKEFEIKVLHHFEYPKNRLQEREGDCLDIFSYSLRYLLGILLNDNIKFSENIFGGKSEKFELMQGDIYQKNNLAFWEKQKEILKSNEYDWIVSIDIEGYYKNINTKILIEKILEKLNKNCSEHFKTFIEKMLNNSLSIGQWCDHFIQNIYLADLDTKLAIEKWKYLRLTDDIRVFCRTEEDANQALNIIEKELKLLNLKINHHKLFVLREPYIIDNNKKNEKNYSNFIYDEQSPGKVSAIINIKEIDNHEVETIFRITSTSYDYKIWCNPYFDVLELPKHLKFKDILEDKSGYKLGEVDINLFLDQVEKGFYENKNGEIIEKLRFLIQHSYGNYKFYNRLIKLYVHFIANSDIVICIKESEKMFDAIYLFERVAYEQESYKCYIFLKELFLENDNKQNSFLAEIILMKNKNFGEYIIKAIFVILKQTAYNKSLYLKDILKYIIEKGKLDKFHNSVGDKVFWKTEEFWFDELNRILDNDKESNSNVKLIIDFIEDWFIVSARFKLAKAKSLFFNEYYKEGYILFDELAPILSEERKTETMYYFYYAYCLSEVGKKDEAIENYTKCLKNEKSSSAYNNRALLYQEFKQYENAIMDFDKAIEIGEEPLYYKNKAKLLLEMKKYNEALVEIKKAYKNNEKDYYTYLLHAEIIKEMGMKDEAIEILVQYNRKQKNEIDIGKMRQIYRDLEIEEPEK